MDTDTFEGYKGIFLDTVIMREEETDSAGALFGATIEN